MQLPPWTPKLVLIADALAFIGFGAAFVVAPKQLFEPLGIALTTSAAEIEIRSIYGGLELGLGFYVLWALRDRARLRQALVMAGLALGTLAVVRAVAMLVAGDFHPVILALWATEVVGALANWVGYRALVTDASTDQG